MEAHDATSEQLQNTTKHDALPDDWAEQVVNWKLGKDVPVGTHVDDDGTLVVENSQVPPAPEPVNKPVVEGEEPSAIDTHNVATLPSEELPEGGLNLYTDFVKGAPNPNLVNQSLEEQILKKTTSETAGPSFTSRFKNRLGTLSGRIPSNSPKKGYEPYPGD